MSSLSVTVTRRSLGVTATVAGGLPLGLHFSLATAIPAARAEMTAGVVDMAQEEIIEASAVIRLNYLD